MSITLSYILVAIVLLDVVITCVVFFVDKQRSENRLTPLTSVAVALVLTGMLIGGGSLLGYALVGAGVLLALADMLNIARRA